MEKMTKSHTEIKMLEIPKCDFCREKDAVYDGKTKQGPWAYMCEYDMTSYGLGLGLGLGQKLIKIGN